MLQIENGTPFAPKLFVLPDARGVDTLLVTVKGTFAVEGGKVRVAAEQAAIVPGDAYAGEPGRSSLRQAGEAHLPKPASDVVVVGAAHAPGGRPATQFAASLRVGRLQKIVRVHGERVWVMGVPSDAAAVTSVPLTWERAYGGSQDLGEGRILCEPRNPVGCGFRGQRSARELDGQPVPNVEDPARPLRHAGDRAPPAGMTFVAPAWEPRAGFAGTYDEAWRKERAPYLPRDFDPRFFQAAPEDQIWDGHLRGGEDVELVNLSPAGVQAFRLPAVSLAAAVDVAGTVERPPFAVETLLLEPERDRFSLLWRAAVACDKRALRIRKVTLGVARLEGVSA